jgi:sialate O-acetylesterase
MGKTAPTTGWNKILNLEGLWKFQIGDNPQWAQREIDDSRWDSILVPSEWENQGYSGYDGYAWYRKHFYLDKSQKRDPMYLHLGYIDDVSECYLNGTFIGYAGRFPPNFYPGDALYQLHLAPQELLLENADNVIAIRVFDLRLVGGITHKRIGLFEPQDYLRPTLRLDGKWKFKTGDRDQWRKESFDDSDWNEIRVPGLWDVQGYRDYDGFAWYRMKFKVPPDLMNEHLILLLGKIDDVDETYLNGKKIGQTGLIYPGIDKSELSTEWLELRAYPIPSSLLHIERENTLAVRVCDVWLNGGIYDGPVGLVTEKEYQEWEKANQPETLWEYLKRVLREL